MNKKKRKNENFITTHKIPLIITTLIIAFIIGGVVLLQSKNSDEKKNFVENDSKKIEDFTKIEQEILNITDTTTEIEKKEKESYSEEYKKYEELSEEEKEKLEVVPRKEEVPFNEIEDIKEKLDYEEEKVSIPTKYNLNEHINLKVEYQDSYGLCWAFAALNSLETNIALNEGRDLDLSELHLDYSQSNLMYGYRNVHNGGNFSNLVDYSLFSGAVLEETVPYGGVTTIKYDNYSVTQYVANDYTEEEYSKFTNMDIVARATEVVDFPSVRKSDGKVTNENMTEEELTEFRNVIKTHIMKNGSIYASIKIGIPSNVYCNKDCMSNHAISIVGWDDNYSKDNFTTLDGIHPIHDGAYIFLNSYGEGFGDGGYGYISYDDALVESHMSGVVSASMDNAVKISSIKNPIIKDIIYDKLKYYIVDYNNDKYITKLALGKFYSVDLKNKNLTSRDLDGLEIFSNLAVIDLSDNNITDVSILSKLKRLNSINLSNNNVTDVSVLKDLELLSYINLSGNKNVKGYEKLNKNLIDLFLNNDDIVTLPDISHFEKMYTLELANNTQLDYNNLKLPKSLSYLTLDNTNFTGVDLSDYENLYYLSIKNNHLKTLDSLTNVKKLTSLDVSNNEIMDFSALNKIFKKSDDEKAISRDITYGYYQFTSLIAKENNISDMSLFNNIKVDSLDLSNNKITDLSNYKNDNLKTIILSNNNIEKGFGTLNNINFVYLENCGLSSVDGLLELDNIKYLVLNDNNITSLKDIGKLIHLKSLSLKNNKISDLSDISELKELNSLSLDNNDITDITPLNKIENLYTLSLSSNKNIRGKLPSSISSLNIDNCILDESFDLNDASISYINISNSNFSDIESIINNNSSFNTIEAEGLEIPEDQFLKIKQSTVEGKYWYITGANVNVKMDLDQNNNLLLDNKYYIRKILMSELNNDVVIENGDIDNKVNFIHVLDPDKKAVSFKVKQMINNYSAIDFSISF